MTQPGPTKNRDVVAEVLMNLNRKKVTVTQQEAQTAIDTYNKMTEEYHFLKKFHEENKGAYSSHSKKTEEKGKVGNDANTQNKNDPQPGGPNAYNKAKEEIEKLKAEKKNLVQKIDELRNRLSSVTGQKLSANNPDIADLSDPHRPTNLAELFRGLYDDEWTHAFEELDSKHVVDEFKIIDFLTNIIKDIDCFCGDFSDEQVQKIKASVVEDITNPRVQGNGKDDMAVGRNPSEMDTKQTDLVLKMIRDLRKSFGNLSVGPLIQIFDRFKMVKLRQSLKVSATSTSTNSFVAKAVEIVWLMKIQHPPMELVWQKEGEKYDKDRFAFYTKRGECVKQTVWPAVVLHNDGPLMCKGILQAK